MILIFYYWITIDSNIPILFLIRNSQKLTLFSMANSNPRYSTELKGSGEPKSSSANIKVLNFNIWSLRFINLRKRSYLINMEIAKNNPDIIVLQEVTLESLEAFQDYAWWNSYHVMFKEEETKKMHFCMLLSKFRVKDFFERKPAKGVFIAKLFMPTGKVLTVATCHLKRPEISNSFCDKRRTQATNAVNVLNLSTDVILAGDMNWDEQIDGSFPLLDEWCDAWSTLKPKEKGYTYDNVTNPMLWNSKAVIQKRLDRILVKLENYDMVDIKLIGNEIADYNFRYQTKGMKKRLPLLPSDHFGLLFTVRCK